MGDVYIRINKELNLRNSENKIKENLKKEENEKEEIKTNSSNSFSAQKLFEFFETQKVKDEDMLCKKVKNSGGFDIPNFLNDKTSEQIKKKKEILRQKDERIFAKDIKENASSLVNINYSEFGKGLFNEKYDLDLSEEDSPFIRSHKNSTDSKDSFQLIMDKELEITEAIFDPMP